LGVERREQREKERDSQGGGEAGREGEKRFL